MDALSGIEGLIQHFFQHFLSTAPVAYAQISQTISLNLVKHWAKENYFDIY